MPAFSVVKYKQAPFINLFERTIEKHRIKMKSYVAVQKKLLIIIYALWKKDEAYRPEYQMTTTREQEQESPSLSGFTEAERKLEVA